MDYDKNKQILQNFYSEHGISEHFEKDNHYLEAAFHEITEMWLQNLEQIKEVRYLMIAEAPLWGKDKSYIYNPAAKNTSFFHKGHLEYVLKTRIANKQDLINKFNEIGLLVIDVSPFALNLNTIINYMKNTVESKQLCPRQYRALIEPTIPFFFTDKIKLISSMLSDDISMFYRYGRVRTVHDIISKVLVTNRMIRADDDIPLISKQGGMIDKAKLTSIMNI